MSKTPSKTPIKDVRKLIRRVSYYYANYECDLNMTGNPLVNMGESIEGMGSDEIPLDSIGINLNELKPALLNFIKDNWPDYKDPIIGIHEVCSEEVCFSIYTLETVEEFNKRKSAEEKRELRRLKQAETRKKKDMDQLNKLAEKYNLTIS